MKIYIAHIISFLLLLQISAIGQDYAITSYSKTDGLPTNYCYNMVEDEAGFIWIATEAGLSTFNGHTFQNDPYPELAKKEIIRILKDSTGRIWFNELTGNVYYLDNDEIKEFIYPKELTNSTRVRLCLDDFGHIWIAEDNGFGIIGVDINTLKIKYKFSTFREQINLLSKQGLIANPENTVYKNDSTYYTVEGQEFKSAACNIYDFLNGLEPYNEKVSIFNREKGFFTYSPENGLVKPILLQFNSYFEFEPFSFLIDKHGSLWVATRDGTLRIEDPLMPNPKLTKYFSGKRSGSLLLDNQNNIWVSTLDDGIRKLTETHVQCIEDERDRNITSLIKHNGYLVYLTAEGYVTVLNKDGIEVLNEKTAKEIDYGYDVDVLDASRLLITTGINLCILDLNKMKIDVFQDMRFLKSASIFKNKIWLNSGISNYVTSIGDSTTTKIPPHKRSYAVLPISEEIAYIGTVSGLYKTNSETHQTQQICSDKLKDYIKTIERASDGSLWIGTYGNGIYIMNNDTISHHISNLNSNYINKIVRDKDVMWVGSNRGLLKITKAKNDYIIKILDKSDGLFSDEIRAIDISEGKIRVASGKGISIMNQNIKFNNFAPRLKIENIKINERDTNILSSYQLDTDQRNVKINFGGILFSNPNLIVYKYMMKGLDQDWISSDENIAQYPSLPAGEYTFRVKTKTQNSIWSDIKEVHFNIPHKLINKNWFRLLLTLTVFGIMLFSFIYYNRILETQRQNQLLQMASLRSQMNPHFIFNSLNSVQDFVLRDDKRSANKYISKISKLMRYFLNASDKEFTSLKEELDALDIYLSIEAMRFDNSFAYVVDIDPSIDTLNYKIPTMIIQPYLENAIKHGLLNAEGDKLLYMRVNELDEGLHFEITDNGVGREKSKSLRIQQDQNHDSKGTSINQKRIELLNKSYKNKNKVIFEDLFDEFGSPNGTKVDIFLKSIKLS